jgi:hypothetical protein
MLASHHWCHDSAAGPADTRSNRPREGEPSYATSSAATDRFLHGCAAGEHNYQSDYRDNLHRASASLIEPCHDQAGFGNSSPTYLGITNCLLLTSTARGYERECDSYNCKRLCHSFPEGKSIFGNF